MADKSAIEWTDATWNPVTGCTQVSPGCDHCYALSLARRLKAMGSPRYQRDGGERSGPGFGVTLQHDLLTKPATWAKPRRIFVNSMSDLFHADIPTEYIAQVWAAMAATPQHTFQVLTKRTERMRRVVPDLVRHHGILPHVWLGTSIEDARYAWRADQLRATPAAVRFVSCEPLLGEILDTAPHALRALDWVIVGGESGSGARPVHPAWVRALRDDSVAAARPFFFKQWGAWAPIGPVSGFWATGDALNTHDRVVNAIAEGRTVVALDLDGSARSITESRRCQPGAYFLQRMHKHTTGRTLDGLVWDEQPTPREVPAHG